MKKLWFWITYHYHWYKHRQFIKQRIKQLKGIDPYIYK
jgi:hypothetical protein